MVFVLMSRRTQETYAAVFNFINTKILRLDGAKMFITDYEVAKRNALVAKYPLAEFTACFFHFAQACRRKATKINGLIDLIKTNSSAHNIFYKLMYLALLPTNCIDRMFTHLMERAKEVNNAKLNEFMKYYRRQWILKEGADKISVFGSETKATSPAEGYNRALNEYCKKKGSFVWFCVSIRNQEFMKTSEFVQFVESGGLIGSKQKKDDKVRKCTTAFY